MERNACKKIYRQGKRRSLEKNKAIKIKKHFPCLMQGNFFDKFEKKVLAKGFLRVKM